MAKIIQSLPNSDSKAFAVLIGEGDAGITISLFCSPRLRTAWIYFNAQIRKNSSSKVYWMDQPLKKLCLMPGNCVLNPKPYSSLSLEVVLALYVKYSTG